MSEQDAEGDDTTDVSGENQAGSHDSCSNVESAVEGISSDIFGNDTGEFEEAAIDPDEQLVNRVEESDVETLAIELTALRSRIETLENQLTERETEIEELESRLARKQADFQNYKKRQKERLQNEKARATEDLIKRLLDVRDNLKRALDQDEGADIRGGVESTLRQLDQEFERENVERIDPKSGKSTDPQRHEVLMRVESEQPEGTIADVHRSGYEMAGKVLRAAQVTVSEGPSEEPDDSASSGADDDGDGK